MTHCGLFFHESSNIVWIICLDRAIENCVRKLDEHLSKSKPEPVCLGAEGASTSAQAMQDCTDRLGKLKLEPIARRNCYPSERASTSDPCADYDDDGSSSEYDSDKEYDLKTKIRRIPLTYDSDTEALMRRRKNRKRLHKRCERCVVGYTEKKNRAVACRTHKRQDPDCWINQKFRDLGKSVGNFWNMHYGRRPISTVPARREGKETKTRSIYFPTERKRKSRNMMRLPENVANEQNNMDDFSAAIRRVRRDAYQDSAQRLQARGNVLTPLTQYPEDE